MTPEYLLSVASVGGYLAGAVFGLIVGHWYGYSVGRQSVLTHPPEEGD